MKVFRSILLLVLSSSSLVAALPVAAKEKQTWGQWFNKVASDVSMTIYNSPKLDGSVLGLEKFLAASTDILIKLGLSGPRVENRRPGQCPRKYLPIS